MAKTKQTELKIVGKGVEPLRIAEIDKLAEVYVAARDKRLTMTPKEVTAKQNLIASLHENAEKIGTQPDGRLVYRYDEMMITLSPGKDKLKVEDISDKDDAE
jgi:hypothetical protein